MFRRGSALSRIAAVGLLALAIVVPYVAVVEPLMNEHDAYQDSIDQSLDLIRRYETRRTNLKTLKANLERIRSNGVESNTLLKAQSDALAAASLQRNVTRLVSANGGRVASTQPITEAGKETFQKIVIRTQMKLSTGALLKVLHRLESGKPYLFIDNLVIRRNTSAARRSRRVRRRSTPRRKKKPDADFLDVRLDVYGYIRNKGAS